MRRFGVPLFVSAFILVIVPQSSFGWGREGHEIVATIAESRLSPRAKAGVRELLGDASLGSIASWADEIRKDRDETGPWHYIDIPYEMKSLNLARDGKDGNNVVSKIAEFADALNNPRTPRDKRIEALKFLVHFLGDIHQPLHCAERNGDKGGNFRLVFFLDEPKAENLHRVWDSSILKYDMKQSGKDSAKDFAEHLAKSIDEKEAKKWMGGDPSEWATESHDIAVSVAYANIPADGPPPKIDEKYLQAAVPAVELQLEKGGVRLADVLNRIFH